MKTAILFSVGLIALLSGCCKNSEADLPKEVNLGKSVVYLNGCKEDYEPAFLYIKAYNILNFVFVERDDDIVNTLGFSYLPIQTGNFELDTARIIHVAALTSFGQTVDYDLLGYEYALVNPEEGFFKVETLDTVKQEVSGHFKAKFKRTTKNGYDNLGLPENLTFEGVFYEKYVVR